MPTDTEKLARLEQFGFTCAASRMAVQAADIRHALALIDRYRVALIDIEEEANVWLHSELKDATETITAIGQILAVALTPDPAPKETEVKR